jgi:hypothetical protein
MSALLSFLCLGDDYVVTMMWRFLSFFFVFCTPLLLGTLFSLRFVLYSCIYSCFLALANV